MQAATTAELVTAILTGAGLTGAAIVTTARLAAHWVDQRIRIAHAEMLAALDDRFVPRRDCDERCKRAEAERQVLARRALPALNLQGEET